MCECEGKIVEKVCVHYFSHTYSGLRYATWQGSKRERKHSLTNMHLDCAYPASVHMLVNITGASSSAHPSTLLGHFCAQQCREVLQPADKQMKETLV